MVDYKNYGKRFSCNEFGLMVAFAKAMAWKDNIMKEKSCH